MMHANGVRAMPRFDGEVALPGPTAGAVNSVAELTVFGHGAHREEQVRITSWSLAAGSPGWRLPAVTYSCGKSARQPFIVSAPS